ncbi:MAG: NADH-quinone oxidoreductase subunit C [Bryobacterales bacterium]|nr:NADH-quinone oxidoreductase subunit C [Bryobacterales bacterium]
MADQPKPEGKAPTAPVPPAAPKAPPPPPQAPATPWESGLTRALKERFGDQILEFTAQHGQEFLVAKPEAVIPILGYLKSEAAFDYLVDVTAVDYPKRAERFDLVYVLYSFARNQRIRLKTRIPEGYQPPTATDVHLTADWLEREVFDMFGIEFSGHPNMRRILMPEEWEGYPLRKDYSILRQDEAWVRQNLGIESAQ